MTNNGCILLSTNLCWIITCTYFVVEKVIHGDQFAYKKGHSSTMALIKAQHTWMEWLDGDASVVRVFSFDFSKAFDTVPHEILCNKLKELPISPYIIN